MTERELEFGVRCLELGGWVGVVVELVVASADVLHQCRDPRSRIRSEPAMRALRARTGSRPDVAPRCGFR